MTDATTTIITIIARLAEFSEEEKRAFVSAIKSQSPVMPWAVIHVAADAVSRILRTGSKMDHQSAVKSALLLDEDQETNTTAALLGSLVKITALAVKVATTRADARSDINIRRVIEACEDNCRACRISQKEWDFLVGLVLDCGVTADTLARAARAARAAGAAGAASEGDIMLVLDETARTILAAAAEERKGEFQEASVARLFGLVLDSFGLVLDSFGLSSTNKKRKAESESEESSALLLLTPPPSRAAGAAETGEASGAAGAAGAAAPVKQAVSLKRARRDLTNDLTACACASVASVV